MFFFKSVALIAFIYFNCDCFNAAAETTTAKIVPGNADYTYYGCYNETTGNPSVGNKRALAGGNMTSSHSMTIQTCLTQCSSSSPNNVFAGLEYGRECWCAPDLNSFANKLPDANCTLPCAGNATEICGGALTITTYQKTPASKSDAGVRNLERQRGILAGVTLLIWSTGMIAWL